MATPDTLDDLTKPGRMLAGKYRVVRTIGKGGMGVVLEALHVRLGDRVAIKLLRPEQTQDRRAVVRLQREACATAKIHGQHVVRVSDAGWHESQTPYLAMELLEGEDLAQLLNREGPLAIGRAIDYLVQAASAVVEAHALGIIHRDLKPANLFLAKRPIGPPIIKVLDFGLSKTPKSRLENLTRPDAAVGSALYMSPEQMKSAQDIDGRTDVYALGVTLFELLSRSHPYVGEALPQLCARMIAGKPASIQAHRPDVPASLASVLVRAYATDVNARYPSVAHFVLALSRFAPVRSHPLIADILKRGGLDLPRWLELPLERAAPPHLVRSTKFRSVLSNGLAARCSRRLRSSSGLRVLAGASAVALLGLGFGLGYLSAPPASSGLVLAASQVTPSPPSITSALSLGDTSNRLAATDHLARDTERTDTSTRSSTPVTTATGREQKKRPAVGNRPRPPASSAPGRPPSNDSPRRPSDGDRTGF